MNIYDNKNLNLIIVLLTIKTNIFFQIIEISILIELYKLNLSCENTKFNPFLSNLKNKVVMDDFKFL